MNSMTNMAEYGKKPHTALAERIFFPLTKKCYLCKGKI